MRLFLSTIVSLLILAPVVATDWRYIGPEGAAKAGAKVISTNTATLEQLRDAEEITKELRKATESMILELKALKSDTSKDIEFRKRALEQLWKTSAQRLEVGENIRRQINPKAQELKGNPKTKDRYDTLILEWSRLKFCCHQFTTAIDSKQETIKYRSKFVYPANLSVTMEHVEIVFNAVTSTPAFRDFRRDQKKNNLGDALFSCGF